MEPRLILLFKDHLDPSYTITKFKTTGIFKTLCEVCGQTLEKFEHNKDYSAGAMVEELKSTLLTIQNGLVKESFKEAFNEECRKVSHFVILVFEKIGAWAFGHMH